MTSPCDTCRRPGACCHAFTLSIAFWDDEDIHAQWEADRVDPRWNRHDDEPLKLPFEPLYRNETTTTTDPTGRTYSQWRFTCPKLGADGRCTIYATRPKVCRDFEPGSDPICVLHPEHATRLDKQR